MLDPVARHDFMATVMSAGRRGRDIVVLSSHVWPSWNGSPIT